MKAIEKTLVRITLSGSGVTALADTAQGQSVAGVAVKAVPLDQLPEEVQGGSVQVKNDDERTMTARANVTPEADERRSRH
ncbi:MAG: hypothetical protein WCA32_04940 [Chromatiaceae bacterium]|jgi:hypothetical protein